MLAGGFAISAAIHAERRDARRREADRPGGPAMNIGLGGRRGIVNGLRPV